MKLTKDSAVRLAKAMRPSSVLAAMKLDALAQDRAGVAEEASLAIKALAKGKKDVAVLVLEV
jgi:hypothetical protein